MGYFFRRSSKIGPFRLNFSRSGIGASIGIKGARLTMTPRGTTYITVGSHGFYYRETLSQRRVAPAPPSPGPVIPSGEIRRADDIVTADVSELVGSSSEALIDRLNERARMFNPAWMFYVAAAAMSIGGLTMFSSQPESPALPDTSSLTLSRQSNTRDEYSMLVARYGEPDSVLLTEPLGIVPVRTARYFSAQVNVLLVPTGCVDSYEYEEARRASRKVAGRAEMKRMKCVLPANEGWTIERYFDTSDNSPVSAERAQGRLDRIELKRTAPPIVQTEENRGNTKRSRPRNPAEEQPEPKLGIQPNKQALLIENQILRDAKAAEDSALYTRIALLAGGLGLFIAGIVIHKRNTEKRTSRLFYELDQDQEQKFSIVQQAQVHLAASHQVWRVEGKAATSDWKRNAGASTLVRRAPISSGRSNPPRVETNLAIPCVNLGQTRLYFLPDVILYWEKGTFGAIAYDDFRVEQGSTRFIEDSNVPADATVVDWTWRYVNKSGGPDRRFNNNVQLPVAQYGVLVLTSSRGLNIHLNTSNAQASLAFANCWRELNSRAGRKQVPMSAAKGQLAPAAGPEAQAFKVLGLDDTASAGEISAAYRHLAQMYHPDKVAGLAPEFQTIADQRMKEINAAYEVLKGHGDHSQPV